MNSVKTMKDNTKKTKSDLLKDLKFLMECVEDRRFAMVYMVYDLECTRRERDYWKKKAENK